MEDASAKGYLFLNWHASAQGHQEIADQFRKLNDVLINGDADGDGLTIGAERYFGTDPLVADTDGDGCSDGREVGPTRQAGGQRNPLDPWDYFNPTHNGKNRIDDVLLVVHQFFQDSGNPGYNPDTDRTLVGPNAWNTGPPDEQQRVDDVLNMMHQFHHDCA
jgi:hypothetical protein